MDQEGCDGWRRSLADHIQSNLSITSRWFSSD